MNRREVKKAPVLRFKGFTNDWEQRKLGTAIKIIKDKNKNQHSYRAFSISNIKGFIAQDEQFGKDNTYSKTDKSTNYIVKPRMFAYNPARINVGSIAYQNQTEPVLVSSLYEIFQTNYKIDDSFLMNWFKTSLFNRQIKRLEEGGVRQYFFIDKMKETEIKLPSISEQNQISKLLQLVNKNLDLQQRKLELLKLFKIGMLQNILADTKAASKLKFKGSNQEWRPRRLNSITNIITKGTTPHFKQASNGVNFIKIEDISKDNGKIYPRSFITEKENNGYLKRSQLKAGDLLFSIAGTLGRVGKVTDDILPANTNQALAIIRLKPSQNIDFCKIMLESDSVKRYIHANPTMGAQPNLSLKQISDLTLFFPDIKEQTLISQLIKKIDNLLALQYQNISKFKQLKQFLLQNIFI